MSDEQNKSSALNHETSAWGAVVECSVCGKKLSSHIISCPSCGTPIVPYSHSSPPVADAIGVKRNQDKLNTEKPVAGGAPFWLKAAIGIFVVSITGITLSSLLTSSPSLHRVGQAKPSDNQIREKTAPIPATQPTAPTPVPPISQLEKLDQAQASELSPSGELAVMFTFGNDYTDLQRQLKLKEIQGKIVEWKLPVYNVTQAGGKYLITTRSSADGILPSKTNLVSTILTITPRDARDINVIEGLKTGDYVKVKGVIDDVALRVLRIEPAVLVKESPLRQIIAGAYGRYSQKNDCWQAFDPEPLAGPLSYCMKLVHAIEVRSNSGDRVYGLTLGEAVDEDGKPAGSHVVNGMVGVFVVEVRNGQPKIVASNARILLGDFGQPPKTWTLVKFGPEYWGWLSETGSMHQGYGFSRYIMLAPYGTEIRDLADGLASGADC